MEAVAEAYLRKYCWTWNWFNYKFIQKILYVYLGQWAGVVVDDDHDDDDVGDGEGLGSEPTDIRDIELAGENGANSDSLS